MVVVKPLSEHEEYWYDELVPWVHYIPFKHDVSDLADVLQEALANTTRLERIADEATRFALRRLNPSSVACYWGLLLNEFAALLNQSRES